MSSLRSKVPPLVTAAASPARALGIVRRVGGRVAEVNYGEPANIDAEFHGRGAEQSADGLAANFGVIGLGFLLVEEPIRAKAVFTIGAVFVLNMAGVVFSAEAFRRGEITIHVAEELVGTRSLILIYPALNWVGLNCLAVAETPFRSKMEKAWQERCRNEKVQTINAGL
jgi:hypothetical protein